MMTALSLEQQILEQFRNLDSDQQQQVLDFIHHLKRHPPGEPGWLFLERTRDIYIPDEDLEAIKRAIEEDCEGIDWNEWQ
jgi:hypothetical protein